MLNSDMKRFVKIVDNESKQHFVFVEILSYMEYPVSGLHEKTRIEAFQN